MGERKSKIQKPRKGFARKPKRKSKGRGGERLERGVEGHKSTKKGFEGRFWETSKKHIAKTLKGKKGEGQKARGGKTKIRKRGGKQG